MKIVENTKEHRVIGKKEKLRIGFEYVFVKNFL